MCEKPKTGGNRIKTVTISEGINGLLNTFREISSDSQKITYIGSPGFCVPFAELLSFAIRNTGKEFAFVPNTSVNDAKMIISTSLGMQLGDNTDPSADTVVLLGGLAVQEMNIQAHQVKKIVDDITTPDGRTIIGVCFMSIFQRSGWHNIIDFDVVLDAYLKTTSIIQQP